MSNSLLPHLLLTLVQSYYGLSATAQLPAQFLYLGLQSKTRRPILLR